MDHLEWDTANDVPTGSDQQDSGDQQLEGKELLAYFGKAILVLLIMIIIVSMVVQRL